MKGRNFVQVGLRGYWPGAQTLDWMKDQGMRWHLMTEIEERGAEAVVADAIAEALDGPEVIYLSVDIDVIDPGMAPGTGTPEPGGMLTRELLRAIRQVVGSVELAAMDVVEVSPPFDHSEVTAAAAHRCVLEAISALAVRRQAREHGGKDARERDERDIDHGQADRLGQLDRLRVSGVEAIGVGALHRDHSRIPAQRIGQLSASHVESIDARRTTLQQGVGESAGRGAHIEADTALDLHLERLQGGIQLLAATRDEARRRGQLDGHLRVDEVARLQVAPRAVAIAHTHLAGEQQRLGL